MSNFETIKEQYPKVPELYSGMKVTVYDGTEGEIIGVRGCHIKIKTKDGEVGSYHPTWAITYHTRTGDVVFDD